MIYPHDKNFKIDFEESLKQNKIVEYNPNYKKTETDKLNYTVSDIEDRSDSEEKSEEMSDSDLDSDAYSDSDLGSDSVTDSDSDSDSDNEKFTEMHELTIRFLSGGEIVLVHKCKYLLKIKQWLNSYVNNNKKFNYCIIEFVLNSNIEPTKDTIGITLDEITEITCIIKKRLRNIMIRAHCTNYWCLDNLDNSIMCNVNYMGKCCGNNCGLIIPKGLHIYHLPKNIPEEYIDCYTDIDWVKFKKKP